MLTYTLTAFLLASGTFHAALGAVAPIRRRDGSTPSLTSDPNTSSYCTWWVDLTTAKDCPTLLEENAIDLTTFRRWNPSITADCGNLIAGHSYCVEAFFEPAPGTTTVPTSTTAPLPTTTAPPTTTTAPPTTTSKPPNGIETPSPTQPTIVDNCNKFYLVKSGDSCAAIASANGISLEQFNTWNPSAGSSCSGLWADAYACVSIIGHEATPTQPGNGVSTPLPTQTGMVSNCNKFHLVATGQSCAVITKQYGISVAQFTQWNPAVKSDCTGLWSDTYACVGIVGNTPTTTAAPTTTTSAGNGITTPTPTQPSMVNNCDSFYYVVSGDSCASIASKSGISLSQFVSWNPSVGNSCSGLWLNAYVCISTIGHTPSPTTTGNGVSTPTPIQDGMTKSCRSFHLIKSGETCATISKQYGISQATFIAWNPAAGSSCSGLWANTYACVAIL